jgi:aminoglycoside 6-adenylyltransferase
MSHSSIGSAGGPRSAQAFLESLAGWAEGNPDIRDVVLLGSQARTEAPPDQWSDVDVTLVVDEPDRYLGDEEWVEAFGRPLVTFVEPTAVGAGLERRVLYDDGLDVDFVVVTPAWMQAAAADPRAAGVLTRGLG